MEQRLSLITLGVSDVKASRAFYERLGWKPASLGEPDIAFFQLGGIALALFGRDDLAKDVGVSDIGTGFRGFTLAHNVRTREAVDAVLVEAEAAGGVILKRACDASWGGYSGYFADPDGHLWEIAWNPGFPISGDGSIVIPG